MSLTTEIFVDVSSGDLNFLSFVEDSALEYVGGGAITNTL